MAGKYRCYKVSEKPTVNVQAKVERHIVDIVRKDADMNERSLSFYGRKWFLEGFERDFKGKNK